MIAYGPGGPADYDHMDQWRVACDGCGKKAHFGATSNWFSGESSACRVYCPRCTRRITRRLLRAAVGPVFPRYLKLMARSGARKVKR